MVHVRDFSMYGHKRLRRTLLAGAFSVFLFLYGIVGIELPFLNNQNVEAQAEAQNIRGFAWTDNAGWISFSCLDIKDENGDPVCDDVDNGTINYGVQLNSDSTMTGYGWSDNLGWLKFGGFPDGSFPTNGSGTTASNAKIVDGTLVGWARFCAGTADGKCEDMADHPDGWNGWISLGGNTADGKTYGISYADRKFNGYAWGSDVVGWFNWLPKECIDPENCYVCVDFDTCPYGDEPFEFSLSNPAGVTLEKNKTSGQITLEATTESGIPEEITFSTNEVTPITVNGFTPDSCVPDLECTTKFTVTATNNAAEGVTYSVPITGTSESGKTQTIILPVTIPAQLNLSCSASSVSNPVKIGDIVTWTAAPDNRGDGNYSWNEDGSILSGLDQNNASVTRTYLTPGTKIMTVTASGVTSDECSVTVNKKPKYDEF